MYSAAHDMNSYLNSYNQGYVKYAVTAFNFRFALISGQVLALSVKAENFALLACVTHWSVQIELIFRLLLKITVDWP